MGKKDKREREKKQKGKRQNPFNDGGKKRKGRGKGKTKQDKNWDKYFLEFQEFLKPKGIFMRDVEGDGNCLFRSVADFVDGDEKEHKKYREMAVEYITQEKEYFALFLPDDEKIDEYIKDMSEDGTWGGHFELVALSNLLNVKFCLHIKDQEPVIVKSSEKDLKGVRMVHLAYHVDEHYSSVRRIGDDEKTPAEPIRLEVKDDDDDSSSSDSEGDSTEGSDRGVSSITKKVEKLHLNDKKNKNKAKNGRSDEEEYKRDEERGKGKNQKNKDKEKDKKEEKGKGKKKGR